ADAYQRAGLPYYPKLVAAVPFTPVTGQRILLRPDVKSNAEQFEDELIQKMISFSKEQELSSIHFLFPTRKEQEKFQNFHFIPRLSTQYHWLSHGEQNFDDYLARLRSKKRKQIQKERAAVREAGVNISILHGDEINEEHIRVIWEFYLINASRKWGRAYLKKEFFDKILENFRHRTVLVLAELNGEWIAGTIGFTKGDVLYGRYWGSRVQVPFLHFECCYYAHIDYAIQNKLKRFEAGAQGEHKFLRGFETCPTYSAHWIARDDARVAIDSLVKRETIYVQEMMAQYNRISPDKVLRSQS
ncbi:MAG: GNAT family N-acetyltransferase, partial [Candidatus Lindowbacteria bacterium]|nr:GNAT family N-acetyltransferase [Candidatus Lindowbacteria bacterium]